MPKRENHLGSRFGGAVLARPGVVVDPQVRGLRVGEVNGAAHGLDEGGTVMLHCQMLRPFRSS